MQTLPPGELPNPLDRVQVRRVGWKTVESEFALMFLPPASMHPGMAIAGIVGNHDHPSRPIGADAIESFREGKESCAVELVRLAMEEEFAVAKPYRAIVAYAAARRMAEQNRLLGLRRNPHPAARTMLLKVHFVDGPRIHGCVCHR